MQGSVAGSGTAGPSENNFNSSSVSDNLVRQFSRASVFDSEEECEPLKHHVEFEVGPKVPLREQLERDKEDESLRRWKEQLLGSLHVDSLEEHIEPEVTLLNLSIISEGRPDIIIPLPFTPNSRGFTFTLKEGSSYSIKLTFVVRRNIVSGLCYINTVWRNGRQDYHRTMLGTYGPQQDPYTHVMEEELTPSGILARGPYTANSKLIDDDKKCFLEANYTFEIRKDWD
ncbi:hypothetical protein O6H91_22G055700 [Diphasiastrum complanatum]|uniref:Uncharacterized protein n=1 Tax=Diphasiastrum complanatum TaxID=34168 RepID=A0ACC2AFM1_DIPCM|nr:hypothetical protein O6H91_22G055700 [Diphasiastrum complanatum]